MFHTVHTPTLDWTPLGPGMSFKPLHFAPDGTSWVLLLKIEPGTVVGRHRHTGQTHGYTLSGRRKLMPSGREVGAGDYVYEPPGNEDSWMVVGEEPAVVLFHV